MNSLELASLPSSRGVLSAKDVLDKALLYSISEEVSQSFNLLSDGFDKENEGYSWARNRSVSEEDLLTLLASNSKEIAQIFFKIWIKKINFAGNIEFENEKSEDLMHKIIATCAHVRQEALAFLFTSRELSYKKDLSRSELTLKWLERYPEAEELALMAIKQFRLQGRIIDFLKEQDEAKQSFRDKVAHTIVTGWGFSLKNINWYNLRSVEQLELLQMIRDDFPKEKHKAISNLKQLLFESIKSLIQNRLSGDSYDCSTVSFQSFFDLCPEYSFDIVQIILCEIKQKMPDKKYENQAKLLKYIYGKNILCDQDVFDCCLERYRNGDDGKDDFEEVLFFIMKKDPDKARSIYNCIIDANDGKKLIDFYRNVLEKKDHFPDDLYQAAYDAFKKYLFALDSKDWVTSRNYLFFIKSFPDEAPEFIPLFKKCEPARSYINDLIKINPAFTGDALEIYRLVNRIEKEDRKKYHISDRYRKEEKVEECYGELLRIISDEQDETADMPYEEIGNVLFESLGSSEMEPCIGEECRHEYMSYIAVCSKVSVLLQEKAWNMVDGGYKEYRGIRHNWDAIWRIVGSTGAFSEKMKESLADRDDVSGFGAQLIPHCNSNLQAKIFTKMLGSSRLTIGKLRKMAKKYPHLEPILEEKGPLDVGVIMKGMSQL